MNKNVKKLWIKALRSGKYKQGKKCLCHGGPHGTRYCCMGVLADLAVKNGVCSRRVAFEDNTTLNYPVIRWSGINDVNPKVKETVLGLGHYNDKLNYNFEQIADLIEKNL